MATVELLFSALPNHVRTARLVAAAVARRAGVDEAVLDEVRLAVGEACSRAVGLHLSNNVSAPVRVVLVEDEKKFSIEVADEVAHRPTGPRRDEHGGPGAVTPGEAVAEDEDEMGLAVISGLVDDVEVSADETGGRIRMSWPTTPDALLP
ncbi:MULTISPECIES: ATP-binding protein [Streptomyces]|uniref:ATP-binding protein n=1 Tax=Streptomyces TaxID=1883 RepID=UPI000585AE42|nr:MULTISPECIES: ATP-binding protein [Streptomyces]MCC3652599.1 ATP-binding protein [Streptomyces sp. S07_1.15]MZE81378.1 ATP-binding protein [Streptomyces sp. SID5475]WSQ72752.1 ATP-binding protein [Streptomyces xinghaiensis]